MKAFKGPKKQGGWIAAAIGAAGAIGSALISKSGGSSARSAARTEAQINRDWQEEISSTAHQREVKDLRLAGLNPILSAGGRGASSPSGAVAPIQDVLTPALNSAMSAKRLIADLGQIKATTANIKEDTEKKKSEKDYLKQQTDESETREGLINKNNNMVDEQIKVIKRAVIESEIDAAMLKKYPALRWLERLIPTGNSAKNLLTR